MTSVHTHPLAGITLALASWAAGGAQALPANSPMIHDESNRRGAEVFGTVCADCHLRAVTRAPPVAMLHFMSAGTIYRALTAGAMQVQAQKLSDADKRAVAEYLSGKNLGAATGTGAPPCGAGVAFNFDEPPAFAGWGLDRGNTRSIPTKVGGLTRDNVGSLKLKWAVSFPDALRVRSQPALAGGAIFVGSQDGTVYSLDRASGCARWTFKAPAEVRTGVVVAPWKSGDRNARPAVYFGDLVGNVYALEASTGRLIWKDHTDAHPSTTLTATPALYQDKLLVSVSSLEEATNDPHYECCTFRGSVIAYDAGSGKRIWQTFMTDPPSEQGRNAAGARRFGPSGAAIWGAPAIDERRRQIYVATGDNYSDPHTRTSDAIVALDLLTGRIKWSWQALAADVWNAACVSENKTLCPDKPGPDYDFGAAPILATSASRRQFILAGQKSGWVFAVDPDRGEPVWKQRLGRGGIEGGVHFGMAVEGDRVFVPINDMTDAVYGVTYPEPAKPGVYALDIASGRTLWAQPNDGSLCKGRTFCSGGYSAAVAVTGGLVLTGSIDGWLRFMDAASGQVLWQFDTTQPIATVGGGETTGGSLAGGTSPIAYHGTVIAESGYDFSGKMPGNVLMVFDTAAAH